jgi:hypothetical protein
MRGKILIVALGIQRQKVDAIEGQLIAAHWSVVRVDSSTITLQSPSPSFIGRLAFALLDLWAFAGVWVPALDHCDALYLMKEDDSQAEQIKLIVGWAQEKGKIIFYHNENHLCSNDDE